MKKLKVLFIILSIIIVGLYTSVLWRDFIDVQAAQLPDTSFQTEYGKADYCYTTDDNFLICKLGE